jgi:titin
VTATGGAHSITVQWATPASDGGSAITSYTVTLTKQGTPSTNATFTSNDGTTHQHTFTTTDTPAAALANNTTYVVQVLATNAAGNSPAAPAGGATATTANVPGTPTGLHVAAGDGSVFLRWSTPANGGSPITAYVVTATPGSHTVTTPDGTTTSTTVPGLTNGTAYSLHVVARNAAGDSAPSSTAVVTPKYVSSVSIATSKPSVSYGTKITVSGHLQRSNHSALAGRSVLLYRIPDSGKTVHIATLKTTSTGRWSYAYAPTIDGRYYARFLGDTADAAVTSVQVRTNVAAVVAVTSPANNSASSTATPLAVKGSVTPNKSGATVTLYWVDGSGGSHKLATTTLTNASTYAFSVKLGKGTWHLRVVIGNTTNNIGARSRVVTVSRT